MDKKSNSEELIHHIVKSLATVSVSVSEDIENLTDYDFLCKHGHTTQQMQNLLQDPKTIKLQEVARKWK